jgi:16S rRNA A1518/A1519 N6-dimethyltransferase RsmA/KsgA/DIM1 with predicted DNA glycosylase/AP lyase activity
MSFESRFGQAADAYQTFRPDYPAEIFRRILAWIPADRRNCAIDLGAGTGKASHELAQSFREVIAIEPDPLMVEKLRSGPSSNNHSHHCRGVRAGAIQRRPD